MLPDISLLKACLVLTDQRVGGVYCVDRSESWRRVLS